MTDRILMKDGQWLVPVDDRPANWREILPDPTQPQPASAPEPTEADVAGVFADTVAPEATRAQEPATLCDCGRPAGHKFGCVARAAKAAAWRAALRAEHRSLAELLNVISKYAADAGADDAMVFAAHVMVAGMWSRDPGRIAVLINARGREREIRKIKRRYEACIIWSHPEGVFLGDQLDDSDIGFWLNAMVGAGQVRCTGAPGDVRYSLARSAS